VSVATLLSVSLKVQSDGRSEAPRVVRKSESPGVNVRGQNQPNDAFRVVQLTPPGSSCSIQIGNGLTDAPVGSPRDVYLVVTDLETARSHLLERGVDVSEIRHKTPIGAWDGGFASGLDPAAETMPALPTSPIRMAIAGCFRERLPQDVT